jgi:hypothetical protein
VPDTGKTFDTKGQLIEWAANHFNGIVDTDASGNPQGIYGRLTVYGKLWASDSRQISAQVDDYMVSQLGGRSGVVVVEGQEYCLKDNGCTSGSEKTPMVYSAPPPTTGKCDPTKNFCLNGESWKKELPATFAPIYRTIGSNAEETGIGFSISHHFCWKAGFIPWSCVAKSGDDTMALDSAYNFGTGMASGVIEQRGRANNVDSIDLRLWSLFISVKSSGVPGTTGTAEAEIGGVCARQFASSKKYPSGLTTNTAAGSADDSTCGALIPQIN